MKWSISSAIIAMLMLVICVSCSNNIFDDDKSLVGGVSDVGVLRVEMESSDTRTYIDNDCHIHWNNDDRVSVFYGNGDNVECRFEGKTGDRSGDIRPVKTYNSKPAILDAIFALYPYSSDVVLQEEDLLTLTLPTIQSYAEDSFGRGANTMVAVSESLDNRSLYFRNMCGTLKLQLWGGVQVKSIRVRGNNNEPLAGNASVVAAYGVAPTLSVYSDSERVVTLDCGGGVQLSESKGAPTTFWVALPPITFDKGFTVEVEDVDGGVMTQTTSKRVELERNTIQPMAAFEYVAAPVKPDSNEIWYTTTDGNPVTLRAQCFDSTLKSHEQRDNKWVISFTGTLTTIGWDGGSTGAFEYCDNLVSITLPDSVTKMYDCTFYECFDLNSIVLSDNIQYIGVQTFYSCTSLSEITLPASMTNIDDAAFYGCSSLTKVISLAMTPPALGESAFPNTVTIYVPESAIGAYLQNSSWNKYNIVTISGDATDDAEKYAPNDPDYISSDYSANGKYVALQTATEGNGIDIVLMGDGYSDRQVASGRYEADMRKAMEAFFSKEPYTSFRHLFNVYMVNLVSKREGCSNDYTYGETALNCKIKSDGVSVSADTGDVFSYAKEIFGEQKYEYNDGPRIDESTLIVIMNSNAYAGVCYMTQPKYNNTKSYGNGASLSFFSLCGNDDLFANLLIHEACGHGFAKLADEYYSSGNGAINNRGYYEIKDFGLWGWFKNVDATLGDALTSETIKWKHFLNDARYDGLVGIYEGAYTFAKNAYRPSEESIMRHVRGSDGEFNAPSREAIYYRIHKLAYGDSWIYDFEEFADYDSINR
ncbi:MAG: leucine-rich repeat protein [Alistipes sp.]|nr:leucine-rich repeat protein [Alistipes sp.]